MKRTKSKADFAEAEKKLDLITKKIAKFSRKRKEEMLSTSGQWSIDSERSDNFLNAVLAMEMLGDS